MSIYSERGDRFIMLEAKAQGKENQVSLRKIIMPLTVLIMGAFMVMFDSTAMNVVIPRLIGEFHSSYHVIQWVITSYLLAESAIIPLTGWLCDRFGTKRISLIAISLFTIGSLMCTLAQGIEQLIIFRILQGLGGGMVIPIMFAYTYRLSPPDQIGRIMGLVVIPIMFAPALGPVLSGLIIDHISWHWIFAVNIPIGIITILIGIWKLPVIEKQPVTPLDRIGVVLAPLAFAGICYGLSEGSTDWSSVRTLMGIGVGLVALTVFIISQLLRENPLLELRIFRTKGFTHNIFVQWIAVFVQFGSLFLIPQALQNAGGYSAFETGLVMLPYVLFAGISNQIGGRLFDKRGVWFVARLGFGILSAGMLLMSLLTDDSSTTMVVFSMIIIGSSVGFCVVPLNTNLFKLSPPHLVGRLSSLSSAIQQVIVSFAISGLATVITSRYGTHIGAGSTKLTPWILTFRDSFLLLMGISILGFVISFRLRKLPSVG
jgi:EmrB/QacA subfamily drug resistance transporter